MGTYELTFDGSTTLLAALQPLAGAYALSVGPRRTATIAYLDTADRRLRKRGLTLSYERSAGTGALVLVDADGARTVTPLRQAPTLPALVDALPAGQVRDLVADAMWIRAVAPVARSKRSSRQVAVLNADQKTVVRLEWVESSAVEPVQAPMPPRVEIRPLRGYDRDGDAASRLLLSANGAGGFRPAESTAYDDLLRLAPAAAARPSLEPGMPADLAVATALLGFLDDLEANVEGTIDDVDTEFLHDLRVAVRRTRSLVKLAGDVLPARLVARCGPGFKWLGDLTTPTRDLDVYQLEMPKLSASLAAGDPADLRPFAAFLHQQRTFEWRKLVRGLKTQRFATLCASWRSGLAAIGGAGRTVDELAVERVGQTFKRVLRKARAITPDSPSEDVHALRKRGKELRYALEVFGPLRGADATKEVIKDLKLVQDTLGEFQDGEVQAAALRDFAGRMPNPPAVTLLAMGELAAGFAAQQRKARAELTDRLAAYLGGRTQARIKALLS
ncbi:CHAD domain-containing protein [Fodinicola acaciae]|uniref:CYTH and CHAD domain-containing protein n=1 Tax=Fodinicola acaciae TaxID=2681555 RepID=UPI0013D3ABAF|nr:CHAD domain-containing protein [Fodinicola acaciae]